MLLDRRKLRLARNRKRLTQAELAVLSGINHRQISRYEAGDSLPRDTAVKLMADGLGVDIREITR